MLVIKIAFCCQLKQHYVVGCNSIALQGESGILATGKQPATATTFPALGASTLVSVDRYQYHQWYTQSQQTGISTSGTSGTARLQYLQNSVNRLYCQWSKRELYSRYWLVAPAVLPQVLLDSSNQQVLVGVLPQVLATGRTIECDWVSPIPPVTNNHSTTTHHQETEGQYKNTNVVLSALCSTQHQIWYSRHSRLSRC